METPNNTFGFERYAENVHLLYIPPEVPLSRDMCATTSLLTVADFGNAEHVPQTFINGSTLYRDRVYVSVDTMKAWTMQWAYLGDDIYPPWSCDRLPLGTTVYNTVIELRSNEVSSVRVPHLTKYVPFNYAVSNIAEQVLLYHEAHGLGEAFKGAAVLIISLFIEAGDETFGSDYKWTTVTTFPAYQPWLAMPSVVKEFD